MTVTTETEKVRLSKEVSSARTGRASKRTSVVSYWETRQAEANRRPSQSIAQRRTRIAPETDVIMTSRAEASDSPRKSKRRAAKGKKPLKVDTQPDWEPGNGLSTPRTAASTPDGGVTPVGVRGSKDLRSPGQRKTPSAAKLKIASGNDPVPDFMTQTDQYGNATTPRNSKSIQDARQIHPSGAAPHLHVGKDGKLHEDDEDDGQGGVDACTETLYDSLRLMCCCLAPEDAEPPTKVQVIQPEEPEADTERPRLLPNIHIDDKGKKCLVLDLDETLVHSSFRAVPGADFVIPVQIEDVVHFVYVAKRPGVDEFLLEMSKHYEIIIYTASLNKYADPLLDLLDPHRVIRARLFRESCVYYQGNYVKDLSLLDRDLSQAIIIDNSPSSYVFHPENAIDCSSFIDDPADRELDQIGAFLAGIKDTRDVRGVAPQWRDWPNVRVHNQ